MRCIDARCRAEATTHRVGELVVITVDRGFFPSWRGHSLLEWFHLNTVRKRLVKRPEDGWWSSYNNFALGKTAVAACPIQIDDVRWPLGYRA